MKEEITLLFPDIAKRLNGSMFNKDLGLFLDVATSYTGYSLYELNRVATKKLKVGFYLVGYGNVKAKKSNEWEDRCLEIASKVGNIIHTLKPGFLALEYPYYQSGVKGYSAARSGGTLQLAFLCGMLANRWDHYITKVLCDSDRKVMLPRAYLITYNQWNGQLQKKHTCHRCQQYFGIGAAPNSIENNYADAIMMGKTFLEKGDKPVHGALDAERVDI